MVNEVELKCETSLVAERPETRQHFFYFFTFFGSAWKGAPPRKGARFHVFTVVSSFSRRSRIDVRCSVALRECVWRAQVEHVVLNALVPPGKEHRQGKAQDSTFSRSFPPSLDAAASMSAARLP